MISCIISVFKASVIKTVLLRWRKKIGTVALAVLCTSPLSTWAHNKNHKSKIMGRATKLSPFEQGCMDELHQQGRSCRDIAAELGHSKTAMNNFLRCPEAYGTKKSTGRPNKLSQQAKNVVLRYDRQSSGLSARQIAAENGLDVSKDTISRCLKAEGFRRRKRLCRPPPSWTSQGPRTGFCSTHLSSSWQTPSAAPCDVFFKCSMPKTPNTHSFFFSVLHIFKSLFVVLANTASWMIENNRWC